MAAAPAITFLTAGATLAVGLPPLLLRLGRRSPRLGLVCWQLAIASVIGCWLLAGLSVGDLIFQPVHRLGHQLSICIASLQEMMHRTPATTLAKTLGGAGSAALAIWISIWVGVRLYRDRRHRRRHATRVRLAARHDPNSGLYILDSDIPGVYCIPGPTPMIVASSAALTELTSEELAAVLAHEHAHLAGRDHLHIAVARGLGRALPFVPLFTTAADEIAQLCELRADDIAARRHGHTTVASALLHLLASPGSTAGLAAGGASATTRVRCLLDTPNSAETNLRAMTLTGIATLTMLTPLIALGLVLLAGPGEVALCELH